MYYRGAIALTLLFVLACDRRPVQPQIERIAILRFENLGAGISGDWMGRAFSEVITAELSGAPGTYAIPATWMQVFQATPGERPISAPGMWSERDLALAAGANRIGYGNYWTRAGRLEAQLTIEDPNTLTGSRVVSTTAPSNDVIAAASDLARQISGRTTPYGTHDAQALEAWVSALESNDLASASRNLEKAIAADPDFGPPYRVLATLQAQRRNRDGALSVLETALARGDRLPQAERARIQRDLATLRGDNAGRQRALLELVKLDANDAVAWRQIAEMAFVRREYGPAVQAYRKLLEVLPEDANAWNQLGYSVSYLGDVNAAVSALRRYQALRPADSNPLDSLGDVYVLAGRFREADDSYLQAARKDSNFPSSVELFKGAMARLMSGDVAGADALSKQYADARESTHDPIVEAFRAEWSWISGRRREGYDRLTAFAKGAEKELREASSQAYAELAIWSLMLGERAAAGEMARKSVSLTSNPSAGPATIAQFLAREPGSAAEWASHAEQLFPGTSAGSVRNLALAYALLLSKEFQPASQVLQQIYERGQSSSEEVVPYLLAWSLLETGRTKEAAPLLRRNPVPTRGADALLPFYFPRFYYLRGLLAEKQGQTEEARTNYRLFLQLSGPDALIWGEEKRARAGL